MTGRESTGPESGCYSLDDENQLQAERTLDDCGVEDFMDEEYQPG